VEVSWIVGLDGKVLKNEGRILIEIGLLTSTGDCGSIKI